MYRKKQKEKRNKIIIISTLIICLIVGIIVNIVNTNRQLTIFEKTIKDSILTVQKVLAFPIDFIVNKINDNNEKNQMYDKYQELEKQIEENEKYKIENEELKKQLEDMKKLLDINDTIAEYTYINANVISRNLDYWADTIIINKGEYEGITKDMPVVIGTNLIGKVISTTTFNSTVRLITATDVVDKISVKIKNKDTYVYGILNGYNIENNTYTIEGISQTIEIENGSLVTTTGMGDIFPSGIVIGKITGINTDNFDLSNVLEMQSDVDFNNINYVTVLRRNIWL